MTVSREEYKNDPPLTVEEAARLNYLEGAELWKQATLEACRAINDLACCRVYNQGNVSDPG